MRLSLLRPSIPALSLYRNEKTLLTRNMKEKILVKMGMVSAYSICEEFKAFNLIQYIFKILKNLPSNIAKIINLGHFQNSLKRKKYN
jgi:hypothetical protein